MKRIDSHNHFWHYNSADYGWIDDSMKLIQRDFLPEEFADILAENDVAGTVVVQVNQTLEENYFMLDLADRHSIIKGIVGWVDIMGDDLEARLEELSQYKKLKGFRHIAQAEHKDFLSQSRFVNGVQTLSKYGFTYDILINPTQLPAAIELVALCPNQKFVLDHLAKPYIRAGEIKEWEKDISVLASYENVWCKVSGMVTEADWENWDYSQLRPYIEVAFEKFGNRRLMFGSDWPVCLVAAEYSEVIASKESFTKQLTKNEQDRFWAGNASDFYRLYTTT